MTASPDCIEQRLAACDIGAFEPHHERHADLHLAHGFNDPLGDDVATHDAAEDVDQNAFHVGIGEDDLEGFGDPLLRGAAADIEEIRRVSPSSLMMSMVAMASPAPLTMQPMVPSSFT